MKIGKSNKSGKIDYINKHHIYPDEDLTINLTLKEHCILHEYQRGITDKQSILSLLFAFLLNKIPIA